VETGKSFTKACDDLADQIEVHGFEGVEHLRARSMTRKLRRLAKMQRWRAPLAPSRHSRLLLKSIRDALESMLGGAKSE